MHGMYCGLYNIYMSVSSILCNDTLETYVATQYTPMVDLGIIARNGTIWLGSRKSVFMTRVYASVM